MNELFRTKSSRKLARFVSSSKNEETNQKLANETFKKRYLDAEDFAMLKERKLSYIAEAAIRLDDYSPTELHGSLAKLHAEARICAEWERRGFYPGPLYGQSSINRNSDDNDSRFFTQVILKDEAYLSAYREEENKKQKEWKNYLRNLRRPCNATLLDWEMFDLPWLLERKEKNLGFPDIVQWKREDGTFEELSPAEWIQLLRKAWDRIRNQKS